MQGSPDRANEPGEADSQEAPLLSRTGTLDLESPSTSHPKQRHDAEAAGDEDPAASDGGGGGGGSGGRLGPRQLAWEVAQQARLALPLAFNLVANYSMSLVSLAFVGKLGDTQALAAAAMGTSLSSMVGKIPLMAFCGAVDTLASQASGAGLPLGALFQRAVLFLAAHCVPISAFFLGLPSLLAALGQPADMCAMVQAYLLALLPNLWVDAVARPLNRILVAQRITQPQMIVGLLVAAQHVGACYLCIHHWGWGYLGAAAASVWSNLLSVSLLALVVVASGRAESVFGRPSKAAFQGWVEFAGLAYASAAMKCAESWSFSLMNVLAGWLPGAAQSVAALSVAFNLYGILFMAFSAFGMAASTRVGNALGAGSAGRARLAAAASAVVAPLIWVLVACILIWPTSQGLLLGLFTKPGSDPLLLERMRSLLYLVVVLELFDGAQTILSGILTGAGKQRLGAGVNAIAYWAVAVPVACVLGFWAQLGVQGMYSGMVLGPMIQTAGYLRLIWRLHWPEEAAAARLRAAASAARLAG